ncbi:Gr2p [Chamberlinius hualienensis]
MEKNKPTAVWVIPNNQMTIQQSLIIIEKFSSIFGFLPLFALTGSSDPKLKWKRLARFFYVGFVMVTITLLALQNFTDFLFLTNIYKCNDMSCYLRQFTGLCFNLCCMTATFYFSTVGLKKFWIIIQRWNEIGHQFSSNFKVLDDFYMPSKRCFIFLCVYYGSVITEHLLQDLWLIYDYIQFGRFKTKRNFLYNLFNDTNPFTFAILNYIPGSEMWLYLGGKYKVIAWNYNDFIIMTIGLCLDRSLSAFNRQLELIKEKQQWKNARKIHLELCELVEMIDDFLSPVIFLTLAVTVYFVCNQIYQLLQPNGNLTIIKVMYNVGSVALLAARAGGTILISSNVQEKGKRVLNILKNCPTDLYNIEVERFWDQAVDYSMAFSGAKLFQLNRRLFLTVSIENYRGLVHTHVKGFVAYVLLDA